MSGLNREGAARAPTKVWSAELGAWAVKVKPGEFYVAKGEEAIGTVLGSCVSVCLEDPKLRIGGLNHFMLPMGGEGASDAWQQAQMGFGARYGDVAMELLVNDLLKRGARRGQLRAKVFGGARVLEGAGDVGRKNLAFVFEYLRTEEIEVAARDVGGQVARRLCYVPSTGRLRMRRLPKVELRAVARDERSYADSIRERDVVGEIELF
jgi:chemotaxis protein CheD